MLLFELSTFDLIISIAVIALLILFVSLLLKLKPTNEEKKSQEEKAIEERPKIPTRPIQPAAQSQPPSQPSGYLKNQSGTSLPSTPQKPQALVSAASRSDSAEENIESGVSPVRVHEVQRLPEPQTASRSNPTNSNGKDCPHQFGYLKELPKNRPIPNECFGCQKIVECLVNKKGK